MGLLLNGKTALVTGGSRGIGAACASALADQGAKVVVNYLNSKDRAEQVLEAIRRLGSDGMIYKADVRDPKAVASMVEAAVDAFGKIDILVNNANINFPMKAFIELSWEEIEAKVSGELKALYNCSHAVLPGMIERKQGKLIFISSTLSREAGYGFSAHSAAKAAVDSMARAIATEIGHHGVNVNVVGPGLTKTDATANLPAEVYETTTARTPMGRVGSPDDIAAVVIFLASSLSDYLTGQYIPVNGGSFMV